MKKQIIGGLFALLALLFTVVSCRKDVQTVTTETTQVKSKVDAVKGNFHVENGIIHFDNSEAFHDVLNQLKKFDMSERRHFADKLGFKSLLSAYVDVQLQCAAAEDEQTHKAALRNNADIIDASKNDGTFEMRIANRDLASVLNREGFLYIGASAYRFTDFGEAIAIDGDIERLKTVDISTKNSKNILVFVGNNLGTRAACQPSNTQTITAGGDRRGVLSFRRTSIFEHLYFEIDGTPFGTAHVKVTNSTYTEGIPFKKTIWGNFRNYTTENTLSLNQSLETFASSCPYGDIFSYSNEWTGIDFNGSTCIVPDIRIDVFGLHRGEYISANNTYKTRGGVVNNITCQ
jgi:hypothetical protein